MIFNLHRYSQYYQKGSIRYDINLERDPEVLREIIERHYLEPRSRDKILEYGEHLHHYSAGNSPRNYQLSLAVYNKNCPSDALNEILKVVVETGNTDDISFIAARNPNCLPEDLRNIFLSYVKKTGSIKEINLLGSWGSFLYYILTNPSFPTDLIESILGQGLNNDVSISVSKNPNCPPKAKLDWMRATGKLTKYDPKKHVIDKVEQKEQKEDKDLKELEKLLGKNNNWYKIAQTESLEDWYTIEVAKNTDDPEILRNILEKNKNYLVSQYAALNPNCPSEILAKILRNGEYNWVSYCAANNPNCPPEALAEILKKGNDDWISRNIAYSPNCPPEAKLKWMRATGKLTTYDPKKHIMEYDSKPIKEDEDLKKLEDLLL